MTNKKESILDKIEVDNAIKASFDIQSLQMDKDLLWKLDLEIKQILPKSFYTYDIKLVFDEESWNNDIAQVKRDIEDVESENTLFDDVKKKRTKKLRADIEDIEFKREERRGECPTIEFSAQVTELKYKNHITRVKMAIPDDAINLLNVNKYNFGDYRAELSPKF